MADTVHLMPPAGRIALRGRPDDRAFADAVAAVLGAAPPEPNVAVLGAVSLYWLQPTFWLVECALDEAEALTGRLRDTVGEHGTAVDVSDTRVTYALRGPDAVTLLNRGCSLDLHPRVFPVGRSALCAFAQLHALLVKTSDAPVFQLTIQRAAQRHFEEWLAAAQEG
ncbi:sarcosine oxidase subunit gamma family protein [Azospirillum sp. TSO22-1]|uniref:sarcosine oxidase subunit gamma n=1 Tax=Azospirillum sp. TSO22-1 TaxID=716789 RepID=UPI000D64118E|nr:sarcosine oxidase subunit gamma family protein [Azospirillum sp. TSO22-1]